MMINYDDEDDDGNAADDCVSESSVTVGQLGCSLWVNSLFQCL